MRFLANHYRPLPLVEAVGFLRSGRTLPENAVSVTFDDGFRNVYTTAWPILAKYSMPATVFLVTGNLGTRLPAWPDQLYNVIAQSPPLTIKFGGSLWNIDSPKSRWTVHRSLCKHLKNLDEDAFAKEYKTIVSKLPDIDITEDSPVATLIWSEIHQMNKDGLVRFGSHSETHPVLSRCSRARQVAELRNSRETLLDHLGYAEAFAFPNGTYRDFTDDTKSIARDVGYELAVATTPGLNPPGSDVYELCRVNIGDDTNRGLFERLLLGL